MALCDDFGGATDRQARDTEIAGLHSGVSASAVDAALSTRGLDFKVSSPPPASAPGQQWAAGGPRGGGGEKKFSHQCQR